MAIAALTNSITVGGIKKVIRCDVLRDISNAEAIASNGPVAITSHTGNNLTNVRTGSKKPVLCSTQLISESKNTPTGKQSVPKIHTTSAPLCKDLTGARCSSVVFIKALSGATVAITESNST